MKPFYRSLKPFIPWKQLAGVYDAANRSKVLPVEQAKK
jgi:hypothetical protein